MQGSLPDWGAVIAPESYRRPIYRATIGSDIPVGADGHEFVDVELRRGLLRELRLLVRRPEDFLVSEVALGRGKARVDVAHLNGHFDGFEIKSCKDTLRRLAGQTVDYSAVLDSVVVVTTHRHAPAVCRLVPSWWGVALAELDGNNFRFRPLQAGSINPSPDKEARLAMMNFRETTAILRSIEVHGRDVPGSLVERRRLILRTVSDSAFNRSWLQLLKARLHLRAVQ
jgi:hypothetical protein